MFKFVWQSGVHPLLISTWRSYSMAIFITPVAVIEHYLHRPDDRVKWLSKPHGSRCNTLTLTVLSGCAWAGALLLWCYALKYISTVLASISYSVQPVVMATYLFCIGNHISGMEWFGIGLSLIGIAISSLEDLDFKSMIDNHYIYIGVALCVLGGVCDVVMVLSRKTVKSQVPLFQVR